MARVKFIPLVWTGLFVTTLTSLSVIHYSFRLSSLDFPGVNREMHDDLMGVDPAGNNKFLRHGGGSGGSSFLHDGDPEDSSKRKLFLSSRDQRDEEIQRLQRALAEAKKEAQEAKAALGVANTSSTMGVSLRQLWKQLQEETKPGKTSQKVIANLKARNTSPLGSDDIVLVTHGSLFKLNTFLTQLEHWNGPASLALFMNSLSGGGDPDAPDGIAHLEAFLQKHQERLENTTIHLMMEYTAASTKKRKGGKPPKPPKQLPYPHNPLRNLAMDHCGADYIVALDVDFIPGPPNCYERMLATLMARNGTMANEMRKKKRIMVLPAFEVYAPKNQTTATPDQLPATKKELWDSIQKNRSESFRVNRYPAGHGATNFTRWFIPVVNPKSKLTKPPNPWYGVGYKPGFEPYILAYRPGIPRLWDTFRGFGQNKISWFMELHRAGYVFGTLWDYFVVHLQHPSTVNYDERHANLVLFDDFLKYLDEKYPLVHNQMPTNRNRYFYTFKNSWRITGGNNDTEPRDGDTKSSKRTKSPHPLGMSVSSTDTFKKIIDRHVESMIAGVPGDLTPEERAAEWSRTVAERVKAIDAKRQESRNMAQQEKPTKETKKKKTDKTIQLAVVEQQTVETTKEATEEKKTDKTIQIPVLELQPEETTTEATEEEAEILVEQDAAEAITKEAAEEKKTE